MNKDLEKRLKKLEIEIQQNIKEIEQYNKKQPTKLYFFEPDLNSFFRKKQNKIKLSNHIFIARLIVSVASVFALLKYPDYWLVSLPILFVAVVIGGIFEAKAISRGR